MESVLLGAVGTVAGLVNAFPEETLRLWKLATEGRYAEALDLYRWFTPVLHLDCHPKLVQYIKLAQAMCGYGTEDCRAPRLPLVGAERQRVMALIQRAIDTRPALARSEEHTSELQSLMRISYAVFCLKNKTDSSSIILLFIVLQ